MSEYLKKNEVVERLTVLSNVAKARGVGVAVTALEQAREVIENMVCVIPEEADIPRGSWIKLDSIKFHNCSVCAQAAIIETQTEYEWLTPYCPYCGALMDD